MPSGAGNPASRTARRVLASSPLDCGDELELASRQRKSPGARVDRGRPGPLSNAVGDRYPAAGMDRGCSKKCAESGLGYRPGPVGAVVWDGCSTAGILTRHRRDLGRLPAAATLRGSLIPEFTPSTPPPRPTGTPCRPAKVPIPTAAPLRIALLGYRSAPFSGGRVST